MAAVRLDPDNVQFNDTDSVVSSEDNVGSCPPTANHRGGRERVLSDEGKKLFLAGHADSYPNGVTSSETGSESGWSTSQRDPAGNHNELYRANGNARNDDDARSADNGYEPPMGLQNGNGYGLPRKYMQSASTISDPASVRSHDGTKGGPTMETISAQRSAFGFIATDGGDDDASSHTSSTDHRPSTGFDFMQKRPEPVPPSVDAADFLVDEPSVEKSDFDEKWESTNEA